MAQEILSEDMILFLQEQELEGKIQTIIDAAREMGIKEYTREDAIRVLLEQEKKPDDND